MHNIDFEELRNLYLSKDIISLRDKIGNLLSELYISKHLYDIAFYHPLGFIYATLYKFSNNETIRLHIWDKSQYDIVPIMDIHNHYYTVNSYVHTGCISNTIYRELDSNENNLVMYQGSYTENGDRILSKTAQGKYLLEDYTEIHCAGSLYQISQDQIHSGNTVENQITCTLVYTQDPKEPPPLVLGSKNAPGILYYKNERVLKNTMDSILEKMIQIQQ